MTNYIFELPEQQHPYAHTYKDIGKLSHHARVSFCDGPVSVEWFQG
jgi:hypothetical protein